jgi:universal stress protein A
LGCENLRPSCGDELKDSAEENLRTRVRAARDGGHKGATSITRCGVQTHEIIEEAKESDIDLIVIASHGYTGWKHFCIGSTAERVVREPAPYPVLVVREKEHEFS